jgi:hypothetical protein
VEVAAETSSFIGSDDRDVLTGAAQVFGEPERLCRRGDMGRHSGEESEVSSGELLAGATRRGDQLPDLVRLVDERQDNLPAEGMAELRHAGGLVEETDVHRDVRNTKCRADLLDDEVEELLGGHGLLQAPAEAAHDGQRLITPAVHESIDRRLQAPSCWFEADGDNRRGDKGRTDLQPREAPEQRHARGVDGQHPHRETAVEQGSVEQDIDLVQAVLQDRQRPAAQRRWRSVNAPHLVELVRAGATFEQGKFVQRATTEAPTSTEDATA